MQFDLFASFSDSDENNPILDLFVDLTFLGSIGTAKKRSRLQKIRVDILVKRLGL